MNVPLQVTFRDGLRSEALEARIRQSASRLGRVDGRIASCHVTVEHAGGHQRQGRRCQVHIEVRAPGRRGAIATLQEGEDVHVVMREAFDAVRRQLRAAKREPERAVPGAVE